MARWIAIRAAAFGLRHGIDADTVAAAIKQAFPHRDATWRLQLLEDAGNRNRAG